MHLICINYHNYQNMQFLRKITLRSSLCILFAISEVRAKFFGDWPLGRDLKGGAPPPLPIIMVQNNPV